MNTAAQSDPIPPMAGAVVCTSVLCSVREAALQAVLAQAGEAFTLIDSLDDAPDTGQVLLVYTPPADALAYSLQNGQEVSAAMVEWFRRSERLLAFLRRNRRRTRLLPDAVFLAAPGKWLGDRVAVTLAKEIPDDLPGPDGFFLLLAQEALRRDMVARKLAEELEASTTFAEHNFPEFDLEAVRQEKTHILQQKTALQSEFSALQEEQDAVLRELVIVQEKAASARAAQQALEEAQAKRDRDLSELTARLKRREDEIAKLYASKSYRMTRPLRLLRAALRRGS